MNENQLRSILITVLMVVAIVILSFNPSDEVSDRLEGLLYVLVPAFFDSVRVARREMVQKSRAARDPDLL
jgi:hypothetical protein